MKDLVLSVFFTSVSFFAHSQSNFKKGKIIKNDHVVVECYIDDKDWFYSPEKLVTN